jgi:hypothetical protein
MRCHECADIGFTIQQGCKRLCWRRAASDHNPPNEAARILDRSVDHLAVRKIVVDQYAFEVAKILTQHTSERPFEKGEILATHLAQSLRSFHQIIADLRRIWLLPVGSRKFKPHGYWIITDQADFAEWVERERTAPITQLTWISAVARRNFPVFAEQLDLDFWQEMHGSDSVRRAA